ncbi:MAG TPA: sn-glycerol-3-phosphate ABC transporter ATP-binding protein UgpC [Acidimicrobiales bacterium]
MAEVVLEHVTKRYPDGTLAVDDLDLVVNDREFLVLVGPSGCGKTTALRMVAGLEDITAGKIYIGDRVVNDVAPRDRDVAMVFQSYALYPHLTVAENIGFGLRLRKVSKAETRERVRRTAEILGLTELLNKKPRHLSGGQRQRVAMGRAIVRQPQVFLMDEPLSNLDAKLRVQMRAEIARIQRDLGVTTIYVTHDQVEAMTLGDRVAVMRKGVLQQVDEPQMLYDRPVNIFVAGFIGSPAMNLMQGTFERDGDGLVLHLGSQRLPVDPALRAARPGIERYIGRPVVIGIRPEDFEDASLAGAGDTGAVRATLKGTADLVEAMGSDLMVHLSIDAPTVQTEDTRELAVDVGTAELEPVHPTSQVIARFSPRSTVRERDTAEAVIDTARIHVFDLETSEAIWD